MKFLFQKYSIELALLTCIDVSYSKHYCITDSAGNSAFFGHLEVGGL